MIKPVEGATHRDVAVHWIEFWKNYQGDVIVEDRINFWLEYFEKHRIAGTLDRKIK